MLVQDDRQCIGDSAFIIYDQHLALMAVYSYAKIVRKLSLAFAFAVQIVAKIVEACDKQISRAFM